MTTKPGDITKAAIVADANIDVIQWNQNLNFHAKKAIKTAEEFLPTVSGNWTTAPATQDAALNELGARVSVGNDVANLVTLTGVAVDSVNLGTFTGSTIADNVVIKAALQSLETKVEAIAPSHRILFAGKHVVTSGEDTAEAVAKTIAGVLATDLVFVQLEVADATSIILKAAPTTNTVTITGTLKENDIIAYQVIRAVV